MNGATILDIGSRCVLALAIAGSAAATEVYRCDDGATPVFQDAPCAPDRKQTRVRLAPEPVPAPVPETATGDAPPPTATTRPAVPSQPQLPAPSFFLCTAGDGSRYVSETGAGRVNWVPYTMLAGQSLAEAYGGRDGLASHPSNQIPHRPAGTVPGAGTYVEVVDPCHRAAPPEACAWLRERLDELDGKLRRAFSDTEAQLKQERLRVVDQLRGCR